MLQPEDRVCWVMNFNYKYTDLFYYDYQVILMMLQRDIDDSIRLNCAAYIVDFVQRM